MREYIRRNPQLLAYALVVAMVVSGFAYIRWDTIKAREDSYAARVVVCRIINKRDLDQTNDLIAVAQAQRAKAIADGTEPSPTPEEEQRYKESIAAFLARAKLRAISCTEFAKYPERFLDDPRVKASMGPSRVKTLDL